MKRKVYESPTMQVVEVKQQVQLLAGSNQSSMQNYQWNNENPE
jgi:hypothetical protein